MHRFCFQEKNTNMHIVVLSHSRSALQFLHFDESRMGLCVCAQSEKASMKCGSNSMKSIFRSLIKFHQKTQLNKTNAGFTDIDTTPNGEEERERKKDIIIIVHDTFRENLFFSALVFLLNGNGNGFAASSQTNAHAHTKRTWNKCEEKKWLNLMY